MPGVNQVLAADSPEALVATLRAKYRSVEERREAAADTFAIAQQYMKNPNSTLEDLRRARVDAKTQRDRAIVEGRGLSGMDAADWTQTVLAGVNGLSALTLAVDPRLGAVLKTIAEVGKDVVASPPVQDLIRGERNRRAADTRASFDHSLAPVMDSAIRAAHLIAVKSPVFAQAMREAHPALVEGDLETAGQCVTNHPEVYQSYESIVVKADNSVVLGAVHEVRQQLSAQLTGVTEDVAAGLGDVASALDANEAAIEVLSGQVGGIRTLLEQQLATEEQKAEYAARQEAARIAREAAAARMQAIWAGAGGAVAGASAVANLFGEKKLAADITRYGGAALGVAQGTVQLVEAVSAVSKGLTLVSSLGAAAATGNVLAAVSGLVGLWQASQPTPEQLILQEVGRLHGALGQVSEQIETGLGHLDQRLVEVYAGVMGALGELRELGQATHEQVIAVHVLLVSQQQRLDGVAMALPEYFRAASRLDFYNAVHAGLGYAQRNAGPMTQAEFNSFAATYYTWAVLASSDAVNQPVAGRLTTDYGLGSLELRTGTPAENLSLIERALRDRRLAGSVQPGKGPRANPQVWAVAAHAYAQLQAEWPLLADPDDDRRAEILAVGQGLNRVLQALAQDDGVFVGLVEGYSGRAADLGDALDAALGSWREVRLPELTGRRREELEGVDPFGDWPAEPAAYHAAPSTVVVDGAALPAPDNMWRQVPGQVALADLLQGAGSRIEAQVVCSSKTVTKERVNRKTGESWEYTIRRAHASCA